jgi:hypothetical protein
MSTVFLIECVWQTRPNKAIHMFPINSERIISRVQMNDYLFNTAGQL